MVGRKIRTIINEQQDSGKRSIIWNAKNENGQPVSAGIYLYQIQAGSFVQTKKLILIK